MAWSDNLISKLEVAYQQAYIQASTLALKSSSTIENQVSAFSVTVGETYRISLKMHKRFRGGSYDTLWPYDKVLADTWFHDKDLNDNTVYDTIETYEVVATKPYLYVSWTYDTSVGKEAYHSTISIQQKIPEPTRDATDDDYNAHSRCILFKLDIFFDGLSSPPLTVTRSDYLIDAELLEEAGAESSNPLGAVSANELSFSLYNENGIFSPTNTTGPYYGKIKTNVPIIPYMKPDDDNVTEINWTKMGLYYVSDWNATVTGAAASIIADDKLQQVFLEPSPTIPVGLNKTQKAFFQEVFDALGYPASISDNLTALLLYTFIEGEPKKFLQEMLQGAIAYCLCNKEGNIVVEPLDGTKELRATITDSDQIISVDAKQSIIKTYGGVELTYALPQLTEAIQLLQIKEANVPAGMFTHNKVAFTKGPVKVVTNAYALTDSKEVTIVDYVSSPWDITMTTKNESTQVASDLVVYGIAVDFVESILTDNVTNILKVKNRYIQSTEYANKYKAMLEAFVNSDMPTLTLQVRGNPLLNVGDKIRVLSTNYNLDFTGILQRVSYKYVGSLSCEITLLNSNILEVSR